MQHPDNNETIFAAYVKSEPDWELGIAKSTNKGDNWDWDFVPTDDKARVIAFDISPSDPSVSYFSRVSYDFSCLPWGVEVTLWKSVNNGSSWTNIGSSLGSIMQEARITDIFIHPEDPETFWVTFGNLTDGKKVFKSTNGGINWTNITSNLPNVPVQEIIYDHQNRIVIIGTDFGIYYKYDEDTNWTLSTGFPRCMVTGLKINKNNGDLVVSTYGRGIWKTKLPGYPVTIPYRTGFESSLDHIWELNSSNSYGRIQQTTYHGPLHRFPYCGSKHLTMDVNENGHYATNEALLYLNLEGEDTVVLSFWWKEFNDETHYSLDGVFISDDLGENFIQVDTLYGNNGSWEVVELDLAALASANNLSLNDSFVVKFQQYDNYQIPSDGFAFDEVVVRGPAPDISIRRCVVSPLSIEPGDTLFVFGTIENLSGYDAGSSKLLYFLSADQNYNYDQDIQLKSKNIPPLPSNSSYKFRDTLTTIPAKSGGSKTSEQWYVLFYADGHNDVIETNELNNEKYIGIQIDWGDKSGQSENPEEDTNADIDIGKKWLMPEAEETNDHPAGHMKVYPNPAGKSIQVEFPNAENRLYAFTLKDAGGRVVIQKNIFSGSFKVDTGNLPDGLYLLELSGETIYREMVVVQKTGL